MLKGEIINRIIFIMGIVFLLVVVVSLPIKKEYVELNDGTMSAIVFADSDTIEMEDVEVEVVFEDKIIEDLEKTMQDAIIESGIELLEEKEVERNAIVQEEINKKKEQEEHIHKYADIIIATKDGAILTYNPFVVSNLSVEQYNKMLEGTGLAGCGESYYKMEQEYGVNGLYALSVACLESGYGKHKANTNNFYGMRGRNGWMSFESPDANIQYFGKLMNNSLYKGKDIPSIANIYCPGTSQHWASNVKHIMRENFNKL